MLDDDRKGLFLESLFYASEINMPAGGVNL
jgi:hypothetical protein